MNRELRRHADYIIKEAIRAVQPDAAVIRALQGRSFPGRIILVAVGKAAWQMAKAAKDLLHYIGKGPWEIGFINSHTSDYFVSCDFDAEHFPDAEMKTGMGWFTNLEFELIEPTKGPMPYYRFLAAHGKGFQHFKEILTPDTYDEALKNYEEKGIKTALAGKLGPCAFSNLDTLDLLGCVYELSDGHVMDQLPEGYNAYMYPVIQLEEAV